jgi:pre-60S factor REI1
MNALGELMMNNGKVIGTRQMARYYKQRPRPEDTRDSVLINQMVQV